MINLPFPQLHLPMIPPIPKVVKIFAVAVIIIIGIASIVTIYVIRQTNLQTASKANEEAPVNKIVFPSKTTATPSASPTSTASGQLPTTIVQPTNGKRHKTNPAWVYTGTSSIDVIPIPNGLKTTLYIQFESDSFANVASLSYQLTYSSGLSAVIRSAQGTFNPNSIAAKIDSINGRRYVMKSVFLGTCSQSVCTPDTNNNNFNLVVTANLTDNTQSTLTLSAFSL